MVAPVIACAIAFLAGATDICGLAGLHDLFVSFMSGNTTMLAFAHAAGRRDGRQPHLRDRHRGQVCAASRGVWPGEDTLWPLPLLALLLAAVTAFRPEPARL